VPDGLVITTTTGVYIDVPTRHINQHYVLLTEGHILEDVNKCVLALQQRDADMFDRTAGAIRGRCSRVCNVVSAEMFNYAPGPYTDRVMETVVELRDRSEL